MCVFFFYLFLLTSFVCLSLFCLMWIRHLRLRVPKLYERVFDFNIIRKTWMSSIYEYVDWNDNGRIWVIFNVTQYVLESERNRCDGNWPIFNNSKTNKYLNWTEKHSILAINRYYRTGQYIYIYIIVLYSYWIMIHCIIIRIFISLYTGRYTCFYM